MSVHCLFWVLCICVLTGTSLGAYKRWVPNTNYGNSKNWDAGRVPCQNDRVQFPESIQTVYVQSNSSVLEIVLPNNGEVVLGQYMSLSFPPAPDNDANCQGQDIQFTRTDPESWFDPDNWCDVADPDGACMSEQPAHLDSELVPCDTDEVIFPKGSGFLIDLDSGVDLYMSTLTLAGQSYHTGSMRSFVDSLEGRKLFHRRQGSSPTTINIQGFPCSDIAGCMCGNDKGEIHKRICAIQQQRCVETSCETPFMPEGHCCDVCGAMLEVELGRGFRFKYLENMVHNSIPREDRDDVKVIVSKTGSDRIQIVLQDVGPPGKAYRSGLDIKEKLELDISADGKYGVTEVQLGGSGSDEPSPNASHSKSSQSGGSNWLSGGSIASLVIAVLAIIALIALGMYCLIDRKRPAAERRRPVWPLFRLPFRKMSHGAGEMELGATSVAFNDHAMNYGDLLGGFNNPIYGNPGQAEAAGAANGNNPVILDPTDIGPTFSKAMMRSDSESGFSNPLYGSGQDQPALYVDSTLRMNPVYTDEDIAQDSTI